MTDIYKLFKEEIWKPEDRTKYLWNRVSIDELSYNTDGNIDDLMQGDGNNYSYNLVSEVERDGYVIFTLQNDYGGDSFQAIFDTSNKVDEDKYWEDLNDAEEVKYYYE